MPRRTAPALTGTERDYSGGKSVFTGEGQGFIVWVLPRTRHGELIIFVLSPTATLSGFFFSFPGGEKMMYMFLKMAAKCEFCFQRRWLKPCYQLQT